MKSVIYYCGEDFDPTCGRTVTAEQWLHAKIAHATELHHQLAHQSYVDRDDLRIKRISSAITDWSSMLDELCGKSKGIQ